MRLASREFLSLNLAAIGRAFFAIALIAFGIQHFLFGDFVPGRAPAWPVSWPGKLLWVDATGAMFVAAGVAILLRTKARLAAVIAAALIFFWALLRHIPGLLADQSIGAVWTQTGKALMLFGGAFAVAGSLPRETSLRSGALASAINGTTGFIWLGRICLAAFMILAGVQHFLWAKFVATLVPTWVPGGAMFWTYFAAVALIAGGVGMLIPRTAHLAALLSGVMVFLWVLMLHIPRAFTAPDAASTQNEWIAVFEALAVSGIAFVISRSHGAAKTQP